MSLSIIIPTRAHRKNILSLVNSILNQNELPYEWELIVASNEAELNHSVDLNSLARLSSKIKICIEPNLDVQALRNQSFEKSQYEIVQFLDDDCLLPDKNYLNKVLKYHDEYSNLTALGGWYLNKQGCKWGTQVYNETVKLWTHHWLNEKFVVLPAGNFSVKRSKVNREIFSGNKMGGEEKEFFTSLKAHSEVKLIEELSVYHDPQYNIFQTLRKAYIHGRSKQKIESQISKKISTLKKNRPPSHLLPGIAAYGLADWAGSRVSK